MIPSILQTFVIFSPKDPQSGQQREIMAKDNAKIPVIDISAEGKEQAQVARDLVEAAVEHGFIYVKNTGKDIPVEAIENAFNMVGNPTCRSESSHRWCPWKRKEADSSLPPLSRKSSSPRPRSRRKRDARSWRTTEAGPACSSRP